MHTVTLNLEAIDKVTWPNACPACGHQINESEGAATDVKVRKGVKATLVSGAPKKIAVHLCSKCTLKVSRARKMANFGWGFGGLLFLLAVLHPPRNPLEQSGIGFGFMVGAILGFVGESKSKSVVGLQVTRLTKDSWRFLFKNRSFADLFLTANRGSVKND